LWHLYLGMLVTNPVVSHGFCKDEVCCSLSDMIVE
jgi:hypothetical protein